jgi:hypothetical protein
VACPALPQWATVWFFSTHSRASADFSHSPATHLSRPQQEALLADSVGVALLVVLDRLNPDGRLAFVLHDGLDLAVL